MCLITSVGSHTSTVTSQAATWAAPLPSPESLGMVDFLNMQVYENLKGWAPS